MLCTNWFDCVFRVCVVCLYMEYTYPSWTGPIALPALDSSAINALVIDSVAPRPPSCYKYMLNRKQNVVEVDKWESQEHSMARDFFLASFCQFSILVTYIQIRTVSLFFHCIVFETIQQIVIAKQTHTSKGFSNSWNESTF